MPDNGIVYHYCSLEAFKSIIENKCLWLCDVEKSNDSTECQALPSLIVHLIENHIPAPQDTMNHRTMLDMERSQILKYLSSQDDTSDQIVYSVSFCRHADKLSQWRGYADDATGLCIGFNASYFKQLEPYGYALKNINYNESDLTDTAYQYFKRISNYLNGISFLSCNQYTTIEELEKISLCRDAILYDIKEELPFYKMGSFSEEKELRLCFTAKHSMETCTSTSDPIHWIVIDKSMCQKTEASPFSLSPLRFRTSPVGLRSYYELSFNQIKDNLITEIIIGPKCAATVKDIYLFLAANGYHVVSQDSTSIFSSFSEPEIIVSKSNITYR